MRATDWALKHLGAGMLHDQQIAGQIAAVDGRDIARIQRAQVAGVIPVQEMAAKALQLLQGVQRRLQPLDRFQRADPAEIARRQHRALR